jgi:hypothetical protein
MNPNLELTNGNVARLEAAQRILCPFCGSIAAVVASAPRPAFETTVNIVEAGRAIAKMNEQSFAAVAQYVDAGPEHVAVEPGATPGRAPRKRRAELEAKVREFLTVNPNATAEETRAEVGGRSATIHEIVKALRNGTPPPASGLPAVGASWDVADLMRVCGIGED